MKYRSIIYSALGIALFGVVVCGVMVYYVIYADRVSVHFLDVGQGDAVLIMHGTYQVLIDGGADQTRLLEALGRIIPFWDRTIETVIATHPDADHIDGLIGVFTHYAVRQFWHTGFTRDDSSVFTALSHAVEFEKGVEEVLPYVGTTLFLNHFTQLRILTPQSALACDTTTCDSNAHSIGALLTIGATTFYLGGDLPSSVEDLLAMPSPVTVLKASHHGAKTSTSDLFLTKTAPHDVVISVGAHNRYGHPHHEVLNRLADHSARILRTDHSGTITYSCTQEQCYVATERLY